MKYYLFIIIVFFSLVRLAQAEIEITEIMYAPIAGATYEWVEIYNNGLDSIDLNKYRFFHGQTNSGPISIKIGDTTILQPSKYAIIAKSLDDYSWLIFKDMIFSSSVLSLPDKIGNTYIAISDPDKNIIESLTYNPGNGGSKNSKTSLSKISGVWVSGIPTPGAQNIKSNVVSVESKNTVKEKTGIADIISKESSSMPASIISNKVINLNDLKQKDIKSNIDVSKLTWVGLILVIIVGISSLFLIKKKIEVKDYTDDEINIDDMTIVE